MHDFLLGMIAMHVLLLVLFSNSLILPSERQVDTTMHVCSHHKDRPLLQALHIDLTLAPIVHRSSTLTPTRCTHQSSTMAATFAMALSGSAVTSLSSSAAFGASGVQKQAVKVTCTRRVETRASLNEEGRAKPHMLVAIVAAGAALALSAAGPVMPASAGLFDNAPKVERGSGSEFPGKEGTGNQVGKNSDVRSAAGTPAGEGSGNLVGENQAVRAASQSGTPLGEGNSSGSGVNIGDALKGGPQLPDLGGAASKAASAVDSVKSNLPGGK